MLSAKEVELLSQLMSVKARAATRGMQGMCILDEQAEIRMIEDKLNHKETKLPYDFQWNNYKKATHD